MNVSVSFAYAYTGAKPKKYKPNDIAIKIPNIPFFKEINIQHTVVQKNKKARI